MAHVEPAHDTFVTANRTCVADAQLKKAAAATSARRTGTAIRYESVWRVKMNLNDERVEK
jgi:hypothetical protein